MTNLLTTSIKNHVTSKPPIKCYFCSGNHACRDCPIEANMSSILKKKVGNTMEYFIAANYCCPECGERALEVIGNHTPSLDIICSHCSKKFEVKSKCLSVARLPNDITLPHGSYIDYTHRLEEGLNLFVVIYGIDRVKKNINVREVLYANNDVLRNPELIRVSKKEDSNLSIIQISDKSLLPSLALTVPTSLTFKTEVDVYKKCTDLHI